MGIKDYWGLSVIWLGRLGQCKQRSGAETHSWHKANDLFDAEKQQGNYRINGAVWMKCSEIC